MMTAFLLGWLACQLLAVPLCALLAWQRDPELTRGDVSVAIPLPRQPAVVDAPAYSTH